MKWNESKIINCVAKESSAHKRLTQMKGKKEENKHTNKQKS